MTRLQDLPELGVGLVYWPSMGGLLDLVEQPLDVLEVEPQPFWFASGDEALPFQLDERSFDRLRSLPQPKLVHGIGMPVGGRVAPDDRHLEPFIESIHALGAPWVSEHLSFNRVRRGRRDVDVGFLLPPLQSAEGVAVAVANIKALQAHLPVPFAFETGVSYLAPVPGEMSDGSFFAAVAHEADCGILLDLHNVWANERNGRQPVSELLDELPLERVIELHVAGGQEYHGYWVDAHSDLVPRSVMSLAHSVVARLPNLKAIIYEVMPEYVEANGITSEQISQQILELRQVWERRGRDVDRRPSEPRTARERHRDDRSLPSVEKWEQALGVAVTSTRVAEVGLLDDLRRDPGTEVLRGLIGAVRSGKVADTLTLTTRLLLLTLGQQRLQEVFEEFWDSVASEPMASDEAISFAKHITASSVGTTVPYLSHVVDFELAAHQAVITGEPQSIAFCIDPKPLISALRAGQLPPTLDAGTFEVTVSPPA